MRIWQLTIEYRDGCVNKLYEYDPYYLLFYAFTVFNSNNKVKKLKLKTVNKKEVYDYG